MIMCRYNFCFSLLLCFLSGVVVADISDKSVTLFDKNDVAKYWLIKQLAERYKNSEVFTLINKLLVCLKPKREEFFLCGWSNIKTIGFVGGHKFAFGERDVQSPFNLTINWGGILFSEALDRAYACTPSVDTQKLKGYSHGLIYLDGQMFGGESAYNFLPIRNSYLGASKHKQQITKEQKNINVVNGVELDLNDID